MKGEEKCLGERKLHKSPRPEQGLCPMNMGAFKYTRFWWVVVVLGFRVLG
jgi:hypothetical protein